MQHRLNQWRYLKVQPKNKKSDIIYSAPLQGNVRWNFALIKTIDGYDESQKADAYSIETEHETKVKFIFSLYCLESWKSTCQ